MLLRRRVAAALLGLAVLVPSGIVAPAAAAPAPAFRIDLAEPGDFVRQADPDWCIPASMQIMLNIIGPENDHSVATQQSLLELARSFRSTSFTLTPEIRGASSSGLAAGLTELGAGPYRVTSTTTLEAAVELAARAIRETGRPAKFSVWKGTHSWVVAGFEATADPATSRDAQVTAVVVIDPWYPGSSATFGRSPAPGTTLSIARLAQDYVPWERRGRSGRWSGRYLLVIPYEPATPFSRFLNPN